ncbi:MAG: MarR family transcriptional regulator [Candidatus Acidiferrales bacterium]
MKPHLDPQYSICCLIWQLNHSVGQEITSSLSALGLTSLQLQVLFQLASTPGLSTADLARLTFVTPQNMSLAVSKLARRGHLVRGPHPTSTRIHRLTLTPSGHRLLRRAIARARQVEKRIFAALLPRERRDLREMLRRSLVQFERPLLPAPASNGRTRPHTATISRVASRSL